MDKFSLIISKVADEMMVKHAIFLSNASESASLKFIDEYERTLNRIKDQPYSFPNFDEPEIDFGYKKCLFYKRYLILYRIENHTVLVDYVVDCRQNYKELLT